MKKFITLLGLTAIASTPVAPTGCTFSGGIQTDYGTITSDGRNVTVIADARQLGKPKGFAK